jgi:hypothetical protein
MARGADRPRHLPGMSGAVWAVRLAALVRGAGSGILSLAVLLAYAER